MATNKLSAEVAAFLDELKSLCQKHQLRIEPCSHESIQIRNDSGHFIAIEVHDCTGASNGSIQAF
jgi:hypothetical protein